MGLIFTDIFEYYSYLFFVNALIWLVNISLLYFEYRRKLPQSWTAIRTFWLLNGIFYFCKFIFLLTYFNVDEISEIRRLLFMYVVQGCLSTILLYCSIFIPQDYDDTISSLAEDMETYASPRIPDSHLQAGLVAEIDKNGKVQTQYTLKGESSKNKLSPLIKIGVTECKSRKFSSKNDKIVSLNSNKIRFSIWVSLEKKRLTLSSSQSQKNFSIKKTIQDVIHFNLATLENLHKIKYISPLRIQLKNITDILMKIQTNEDNNLENRNRSYSNNYLSNSSGDSWQVNTLNNINNIVNLSNTGNIISYSPKISHIKDSQLSSKLKILENIYVNLCRNFCFFLSDFLKFMEIMDNDLIEELKKENEIIYNNSNFNYCGTDLRREYIVGFSECIGESITENKFEDMDENLLDPQENSEVLKKNTELSRNNLYQNNQDKYNTSNDFFSSRDTDSQVNNDLAKTMTFIYNILTKENYLTVSIIELKENKNILLSVLRLEIIIDQNANNSVLVSIPLKNLQILTEDKILAKTEKIKLLKEIFEDLKAIMQIKREKSSIRRKLNYILTRLVNDLFFMDTYVFQLFEFNKILVI
jgi:hypothetical protein